VGRDSGKWSTIPARRAELNNEVTLKVVVPVREFMHLDGRFPDQLNQAVERVRHEVEGLAGLKRLQFFDGSDFRV